MRLPRINEDAVFVTILLGALIYCVFFWHIKEAQSQTVVVVESPYQQCVDTCLAYNGYTSDIYNFCQYQCGYPYPSVVIGGVWVGGRWWPRGHYEHRHHEEPRHDHDHHGHR